MIEVFNKYVEGVSSGAIVANRYVRLAVERHINDLQRDWEYEFAEDTADRAISAFPALFRHTVGSYAGKPFELSPWQAFIVGSIWGWKNRDDRTRRFRRAYVTLGRKNGKSTLAAGIAILLAQFDNEAQAQVFIGATKVDQAKLIFHEASRMIGSSTHLKKLAERRVLQINFPSTDSFIRPLGSDRAFDGLNPSGIIFDELHAWKEQHRAFYDTLTTGSASRTQPLRFTITTAGDSNSLLWKEEDGNARKMLDGQYREDTYFAYIATLDAEDDPFDEAVWPKSMPNINISVSPEYIREQAREAEISAAARNRFKRYFANIEVSSTEQAIEPKKWAACKGEFDDWRMADVVVVAVDAGGRNDLASLSYVARFPDGQDEQGDPVYRYQVKTSNYMDQDTTRDLSEMPWLEWVDKGLIKVVPYVHSAMFGEIMRELPAMGGRKVGFDPFATQQMAEQLQQEGFESVQIQQNRFKLHAPLSLLLDLVEKGKLIHDGDPVLAWAAQNLVINADHQGRWMPDRKTSSEKIDPIVATVMALRLAMLEPEGPKGSMFII
jgi:phage terminase large subunit-like protein